MTRVERGGEGVTGVTCELDQRNTELRERQHKKEDYGRVGRRTKDLRLDWEDLLLVRLFLMIGLSGYRPTRVGSLWWKRGVSPPSTGLPQRRLDR